jgi:hypothetical protein
MKNSSNVSAGTISAEAHEEYRENLAKELREKWKE